MHRKIPACTEVQTDEFQPMHVSSERNLIVLSSHRGRSGPIMENFESGEENFELYSVRDREPMKLVEDKNNVFILFRACDKTCSSILKELESIEKRVRKMVEHAITVVKTRSDESVYQTFCAVSI